MLTAREKQAMTSINRLIQTGFVYKPEREADRTAPLIQLLAKSKMPL